MKIELTQKTINFLYILGQQTLTLEEMFKNQGWIGKEYSRWTSQDLQEALSDIRSGVREHQTEYIK